MLPCSQTWRSMLTSERWNTKILAGFCKGQKSVLQNLVIQCSSRKYMVLQILLLLKSEVFYMPIVVHFTLHQFLNNVNKIYSIGEHGISILFYNSNFIEILQTYSYISWLSDVWYQCGYSNKNEQLEINL
jgi:hypothetical protein